MTSAAGVLASKEFLIQQRQAYLNCMAEKLAEILQRAAVACMLGELFGMVHLNSICMVAVLQITMLTVPPQVTV